MFNTQKTFKASDIQPTAKQIIIESFEELFWTIYRKDDDLTEFKTRLGKIFPTEAIVSMENSAKTAIEDFGKQTDTTKDQDNAWVRQTADVVATTILAAHPTIAESFFKTAKR